MYNSFPVNRKMNNVNSFVSILKSVHNFNADDVHDDDFLRAREMIGDLSVAS